VDTAPLIGRRLCGLVFFGVQIDDRFRKFGQRGVRGTFLVEGLQQLRRLRVTEFFGRARRDRRTVAKREQRCLGRADCSMLRKLGRNGSFAAIHFAKEYRNGPLRQAVFFAGYE
jgi:hypothetical protein